MKQYIEYIKQVLDKGGLIKNCYNYECYFIMNDSASIENVIKCNVYCKQKLPEEYEYFLEYFDGGILFEYDNIAGFKFLGTNELIKENELYKNNFGEDWDSNIVFFCELLGNGEYLGFKFDKKNGYAIVHCFMEMIPEEWKVIEKSFDKFMETLIKEKGKEYWFFEPYSS